MYSKSTIISQGSDLVGWSSSTNDIYALLPSALKNKTYNVNDLPGITLDVVEAATVEKPAADYIESVHQSELIKLVDQFIMSVKSQLNTKELLRSGAAFNRRSDFISKIIDENLFYGYVITPQSRNGVKVTLNAIGFYPDASITDLPIYVYKASELEATDTITYNHTNARTLEWSTISQELDLNYGEQYYIGYFQSDLDCNLYTDTYEYDAFLDHFVSVVPITSVSLNGTNRPDNINSNQRHPGFNLKFNARCDLTNFIVDNLDMFAPCVQLAVAVRILSDALASTELNNITMADKFREQWNELRLKYNGELRGGVLDNGVTVKGMIDRLALDFSDLDPACLPKKEDVIIGGRFL